MKKPSDHLFKLIKTLTKSEKRAFRKNALSGKDGKKYLAIFDAIDAQENYDEEAIKKKFKNEKWIDRFNSAKDYVYKVLLNSLSVYNQKHEPEYELSDILIHIRVLQNKGFYIKCGKLIQKAKILASNLGDHVKMLEILSLEGKNHPGGVNPDHTEEILREQQKMLALLENEYKYNELYKRSYRFFSKSGYQGFDKTTATEFENLIQLPLLQDYEKAKTYRAKREFINMRYFHSLGNRNLEGMHTWSLKAKKLFESTPQLIQQYAVNYATTLLNLHNTYLRGKNYDKAFAVLDELQRFSPKKGLRQHERLTYLIEYAGLHHWLSTAIARGDFTEAERRIPELKNFFIKHNREISEDVRIKHYWLLSLIYFGVDNFKESKTNVELIQKTANRETRLDLLMQAYFLELMIFFEMSKSNLLEYAIRSVKRLFQRQYSLSKIERLMFKLWELALDGLEDKKKVEKILNEVDMIEQLEQFTPDYEVFRVWVRAKLENKAYAQFMSEINNN